MRFKWVVEPKVESARSRSVTWTSGRRRRHLKARRSSDWPQWAYCGKHDHVVVSQTVWIGLCYGIKQVAPGAFLLLLHTEEPCLIENGALLSFELVARRRG